MLNTKALQKPDTEKPATSLLAKIMITALITSKNNPNVNTVTGKVNRTIIGFTNKFNRDSTTATATAET